MRNRLFFNNAVINIDRIEAIYEQEGKTIIQLSGDSFAINKSLEDFWKEYKDDLTIDKDETEKELARVTRDYEELAKENDRLKEMVGQLFTANGRLVYANILKERRKGPRRWR